MVKVEIFGLALDENNKSPILILKDEAAARVLPIWIGPVEAMSISMAINKVSFHRPLTHDLLLNVIGELGGTIAGVEITSIENGTFYSRILITLNKELIDIDSRPSDAIALAVRAGCPIFVDEEVLNEAGANHPEDNQVVIKTEDADKWLDELKKLSEHDTKYKM